MYYIVTNIQEIYHQLISRLFVVPMLKARMASCGVNLYASQLPYIQGENIIIEVGDNVSFHGANAISAGSIYNNPILTIGSNVGIGYGTAFSVSYKVTIGDNCKIAPNVYICDNNGHPVDPVRRHGKIEKTEVAEVNIGNNVWIGRGATILKGTTIGDNSVIGTGSVVSGNIPSDTIVTSHKLRLVKLLYPNRNS
jgi:acetyltransferase-like isoleucine patch superfamily enzyme